MKRRMIAAALTATASVLALSSCVPTTGGAAEVDKVRVTMDTPATFDPSQSLSLPDFQLARLSFDTLVRRDDSGLVPGLAASWKSTPRRVEFTIRQGATCSDGTEITPDVVADSIRSFAKHGQASNVAQTFGGSEPTVTSDNAANTVTVSVEVPWAEMVQGFTVAATGIVCPAGLDDLKGLNAGRVPGAESGPYVLDSFEPGVRYTYRLRDDYSAWPEWTTSLPGHAPETIEYVVAPDPSATANLVLSGDLDLARIMPDSRHRFDDVEGFDLQGFPFGTFYVVFNERKGSPFADREKRVAVAEALDREAFVETTTDGTGELANTLASSATPCVSGKNSGATINIDTDAASEELSGVGIRLLGAQVVGSRGAGNVYLEEALRAAGADVSLRNVDVGTWASSAYGEPNTWDLTILPELNFLGTLASGIPNFTGPDILEGGPNMGAADNPEAEAAFTKARGTADTAARCRLYNQAVDALIADADTIPLAVESYIYAQREGFRVFMLGGSLDDHIFRIVD